MAILEATAEAVAAAGAALRDGALVAFPTETVYGLGADACNGRAVAAIFAAKGRPRFNPLIVHVPDTDAVARLGRITDSGRRLAAAFWPGAFDPRDGQAAGLPGGRSRDRGPRYHRAEGARASCGPGSAARRRSACRGAQCQPLRPCEFDHGGDTWRRTWAAASPSSWTAGPRRSGWSSTVVDVTRDEPVVLRLGGVARESIARVLGQPVALAQGEPGKPASPGMLATALCAAPPGCGSMRARCATARGCWRSGRRCPAHRGPAVNLSPTGDLVRSRRQSLFRPACARRGGCRRPSPSCRSRSRARRGDQRPAAAGSEGAVNEHRDTDASRPS